MAVNIDNNNLAENLKKAAGGTSEQQTTQNTGYSFNGNYEGSGIMAFTNSIGMPFSRQFTSEQVTALRDKMKERLNELLKQNAGMSNRYKIGVFDKSNSGIGSVSSVYLTGIEGNNVAVYSIAIEATAPSLSPKSIQYMDRQIQIIRTTGDLLDENYEELIKNSATALNAPNAKNVSVVGETVLYKEANIESNSTIDAIVINAVIAVENGLKSMGKGKSTFMLNIFADSEQPVVSIKNDTDHIESVTGLPVRSDILVRLGVRDQNGNENGLLTMDSYVDLAYAPIQQSQSMWNMQTPQGPTPTYLPRLVITRLDSEVSNNSLSLQLLGLAQSILINTNNQWQASFRPRRNVKGEDTRDIGAIGYEVPLYQDANKFEKLPTKGHDFDDHKFHMLMQTYFHQNMLVSMDVEERGDTTWLNRIIGLAAMNESQVVNNPKMVQAILNARKEIIKAADELTAIHGTNTANGDMVGKFSQLWNQTQNSNFIARDIGRIHLGYYLDENGEKQDIRSIDYLAILNYSKGDRRMVEAYDNTFSAASGIPEEARLEERVRIIQSLIPNVVFKGYARRVEFNPDLIRCLSEACGSIRQVVPATNLQAGINQTIQRGYGDASTMGLGANLGYGMLYSQQPQVQQQQANPFAYGGTRY